MPEQTEIKDKNGSSYMGTIVWLLQGETWPNTHEQLTLNTLVFAAHVAATLLFQAAVGRNSYHHTVRTLIWWRLCCLAVCD